MLSWNEGNGERRRCSQEQRLQKGRGRRGVGILILGFMREQTQEWNTWSRSSWKVKRTLERNRSLLRHLRGNRHVAREEATDWLVRRGFDFDYHTHLSTTQEGRLVVMCYDEGYLLEEGQVVPWVIPGSSTSATLDP